jgi:hypothetical protein
MRTPYRVSFDILYGIQYASRRPGFQDSAQEELIPAASTDPGVVQLAKHLVHSIARRAFDATNIALRIGIMLST